MLDEKMSPAEIRLHAGELTAGEVSAARAAIAWANSEARKDLDSMLAQVESLEKKLNSIRDAWEDAIYCDMSDRTYLDGIPARAIDDALKED